MCDSGMPLLFLLSPGPMVFVVGRFSLLVPFVKSFVPWPGDGRGVCLRFDSVSTVVLSDLPS